MYEAQDNAMQNDALNQLEMHFPRARCTVVTSESAEKNIRQISFVGCSSRSTTSHAACRCTIPDRVRCVYAFECRSVADFVVSRRDVSPEMMFGAQIAAGISAAPASQGASRDDCRDCR